jgi:uncharacterized protein YdaU (DUF1376 family)
MGFLKWYKRDPRAALVGMANLTLEERGAYNTILDLLYCHDGSLVDDPQDIAKLMRVDIRTWKRLRIKLLETKKLYLSTDGRLHNERTDAELTSAELRREVWSELRARRRHIKDLRSNNYNQIERKRLSEKEQGALDRLGRTKPQ